MEKEKIQETLEELGITVKTSFAGARQDRPDHICYNVSVIIADQVYNTIYSQGIGHIPDYQKKYGLSYFRANKSIRQHEEEQLAITKGRHFKGESDLQVKLPDPSPVDIIYSISLDADAINYQSFEDFADCMGYDQDSRQAEKVYNACLKAGLFLRNTIGDPGIEQLQEAYQDY